ncbi:uncharacterized protein LOC130976296 [Arachis stenosperma]|uniref:uncharacterized protein LOC130976296 n=1 Tax=Arachis stenosperma TaxID=217475 RepID=UPI0025AD9352|nr:uncharacterized protein LOC130976296 [Arachis stenosperma]
MKNMDKSKYYTFHQKRGHTTDECVIAKDLLERLARQGHLDKYINGHIQKYTTNSADHSSTRQYSRDKEKITYTHPDQPRGVINCIFGGFAGGGTSNSARKRTYRTMLSIDDILVRKVLLDPRSSADVLFYFIFQKMKLSNNILQPSTRNLVGFSGERVPVLESVWLQTTPSEYPLTKTSDVQYLVVDCFIPYNLLLGRPFLNKFGTIVSTVYLCFKFSVQDDLIATIHIDYGEA